jgi:hypothetical protein
MTSHSDSEAFGDVPRYGSFEDWERESGDSRRTAYAKLSDGRLRAVKDGSRTKIDMHYGLARMAELPEVKIRPPRKTAA